MDGELHLVIRKMGLFHSLQDHIHHKSCILIEYNEVSCLGGGQVNTGDLTLPFIGCQDFGDNLNDLWCIV